MAGGLAGSKDARIKNINAKLARIRHRLGGDSEYYNHVIATIQSEIGWENLKLEQDFTIDRVNPTTGKKFKGKGFTSIRRSKAAFASITDDALTEVEEFLKREPLAQAVKRAEEFTKEMIAREQTEQAKATNPSAPDVKPESITPTAMDLRRGANAMMRYRMDMTDIVDALYKFVDTTGKQSPEAADAIDIMHKRENSDAEVEAVRKTYEYLQYKAEHPEDQLQPDVRVNPVGQNAPYIQKMSKSGRYDWTNAPALPPKEVVAQMSEQELKDVFGFVRTAPLADIVED